MIKNTEFSGWYFYMKTNLKEDFEICISVPSIHIMFKLFCNIWLNLILAKSFKFLCQKL